jgi:hypothetical protein
MKILKIRSASTFEYNTQKYNANTPNRVLGIGRAMQITSKLTNTASLQQE